MAYHHGTKSRKERAEEAARTLSDFVNDMNADEKHFIETMAREHRTLQQSFTGLCFAWIKRCAEQAESGNYDGRNEYSVKMCKEITEKTELFEPPLV